LLEKSFFSSLLVKKPLGRIAFVKNLPMTEVNMPMDDQV
jgi:hypothetical protein